MIVLIIPKSANMRYARGVHMETLFGPWHFNSDEIHDGTTVSVVFKARAMSTPRFSSIDWGPLHTVTFNERKMPWPSTLNSHKSCLFTVCASRRIQAYSAPIDSSRHSGLDDIFRLGDTAFSPRENDDQQFFRVASLNQLVWNSQFRGICHRTPYTSWLD